MSITSNGSSRSAGSDVTANGAYVSGRQKVGFVLAIALHVINVVSVAGPTPDGEVGPPIGILIVGAAVGVIGAVATILAWRGSSLGKRISAGCLILNVIGSLPAFFVDVPLWLKVAVAVSVLVSGLAIVLMFSRRHPA